MQQNKSVNNTNNNHCLTLQNQTKALITGVTEVVSATPKGVYIKLANISLQIVGEDLKVEKLSPEEKTLVLSGKVYDIKYSVSGSKNFFKKLFR